MHATSPSTTAPPWELPVDAVATRFAVDPLAGLDTVTASERLATYGPNRLEEEPPTPTWRRFVAQFANTMTAVLVVAAVVTAAIGEVTDTLVIAAIVVLNAIVGFVQEHRAAQAVAALKQLAAPSATARRDGVVVELAAAELVPGDVVLLAAGDVVPADLRLVEVAGLRVNEAMLTGESEPVAKTARPLEHGRGALLAERVDMAYKGTAVTYGRAEAVVVATGMATELGAIATLLRAGRPDPTPLQRRLAVLGRVLASASLVVCAAVFAAGIASGEPADEMFLTAVSLAVAAIPEGLPAVVTIALALGARRMAERRAIVRTLPAVEALGSVTVICSDKTGTLTENRMLVEEAWTPAGTWTVGGSGYQPFGPVDGPTGAAELATLRRLAAVAAACNDASLHAPATADAEWTATGDPTEAALVAFAAKTGVDRTDLLAEWPRVAEVAFEAGRRRMLTVHQRENDVWIAMKGAVESLEPLVDAASRRHLDEAGAISARWADDGYRVLAMAEGCAGGVPDHVQDLEHDLRLVGLVALADPPRAEVVDAVAECRAAGVVPVVITGDDPRTAAAVARRVGILDRRRVVTGIDLDALDDAAFDAIVRDIAVYARTSPEQKLRIVEAWKDAGAVVAMTGDGVNDAPALRRADIGVAMGITGTDVSKEAADVVLADDNFVTIVAAVAEGRRIYDNLRRFLRYLLATNAGEILFMLGALLVGMPVPLLPVQILWINLVTDGLPAIALGLEPAEHDVMRRPPRSPEESLFARGLWQHVVWVGALMAVVGLVVQAVARDAGWEWQTMVFCAIAFLQLGHAAAIRSERESLWRLGVFSNPALLGAIVLSVALQLALVYVRPLGEVFDTEPLAPVELAVTLLASTVLFGAVELEKAVLRRRDRAAR